MDTFLQWLMLVVAVGVGWGVGYTARTPKEPVYSPSSNLKDRLKILFETYSEEVIESFVQSLEVNGETVDMHLSIGKHFRKNGEVEKAILVHQNLMSRPETPKCSAEEVAFELAEDYMAAGLFDRAESLFKQLVESKLFGQKSLWRLTSIYQQENEWLKAFEFGSVILDDKNRNISVMLAHFCCELAEQNIERHDYWEAKGRLKQAIGIDCTCIRATLLLADIHIKHGGYADAVTVLRKVEEQDARFLLEVIPPLLECSLHLGSEEKFRRYLLGVLKKEKMTSVILAVAESYNREMGVEKAEHFLVDSLVERPSLRGLDRLIEYHEVHAASSLDIKYLKIIKQVTQSLLAGHAVYQCVGCGFSGEVLHWQCPSCKEWGVVAPIAGVEGE